MKQRCVSVQLRIRMTKPFEDYSYFLVSKNFRLIIRSMRGSIYLFTLFWKHMANSVEKGWNIHSSCFHLYPQNDQSADIWASKSGDSENAGHQSNRVTWQCKQTNKLLVDYDKKISAFLAYELLKPSTINTFALGNTDEVCYPSANIIFAVVDHVPLNETKNSSNIVTII